MSQGSSSGRAAGTLDRPPPRHSYIELPESFGRRFAVFVDTEEEFDWTRPLSRDERSTQAAKALPGFQARMREHGVKPIYLIDHPIATDPRCVAMLGPWQEAGECTVGTQLHPWVNPPFEEEVKPFNTFLGNLPRKLQRAKLHNLTETIAEAFGRRPTVYRAGRYGVGSHTAELLQEAGYVADVSVRALFDYSGEGGPDFSHVRPLPFWIGNGDLLEVPLTAAYVGRLRGAGRAFFPAADRLPKAPAILSRTGLLSRVALTPEGMPLPEVLEAIRGLVRDGHRLFSLSLHSPSVEPGHTPYVRTQQDLDRFYAWWDGVFACFAAEGIEPVSMEEIVEAAWATRLGS